MSIAEELKMLGQAAREALDPSHEQRLRLVPKPFKIWPNFSWTIARPSNLPISWI